MLIKLKVADYQCGLRLGNEKGEGAFGPCGTGNTILGYIIGTIHVYAIGRNMGAPCLEHPVCNRSSITSEEEQRPFTGTWQRQRLWPFSPFRFFWSMYRSPVPNHLARYFVLAHPDDAALSQMYAPHWTVLKTGVPVLTMCC
jgi:hypothetical protein